MIIAFILTLILIFIWLGPRFRQRKTLSLKGIPPSTIKRGEGFLMCLHKIEIYMGRGLKIEKQSIPSFLYFNQLLFNILELVRNFGVTGNDFFKVMRGQVQDEIKSLKLKNKILTQGYFQMFMSSLVVWVFFIAGQNSLERILKLEDCLILILLHGSALFFFHFVQKFLEGKLLSIFAPLFRSHLMFQGLLQVGIPLSEALNKTEILKLAGQLPRELENYKERIELTIKNLSEYGECPLEELKSCYEILLFMRQTRSQSFNQALSVLTFILLCLFILPSYFFTLFLLF